MYIAPKFLPVIGIFTLALIVNLPFGYLRQKSRKYSLKWFLYIHLPVPLIILARLLSHIDFKYIPLFLAAGVVGQFCGGKLES